MATTDIPALQVVTSAAEVRQFLQAAHERGESVGFVPTMGALHEGHLKLVDACCADCDLTVVSIFVNPTQFGPGEDHARYPRNLQQDCQLLQQRGCSLVFAPPDGEIYRPGHETYVEVGFVAEPWEGVARPGHFRGVATVVLKLLNMIPAQRAYFGRKDYQQSLVVRQMIADFDLPVELVVCPTVREPDGLAMSSRNSYLSPDERKQATALWQSLQLAEQLVREGLTDAREIVNRTRQLLTGAGIHDIDYIAVVADGTVQSVETVTGPTVMALAARIGKTRLIDNHRIR